MIKGKLFLGKQTGGIGNTNKVVNDKSMQNKIDMLFQPSLVIGRPNHLMMEYSLLSRCNHKTRLDGPKACHLA